MSELKRVMAARMGIPVEQLQSYNQHANTPEQAQRWADGMSQLTMVGPSWVEGKFMVWRWVNS